MNNSNDDYLPQEGDMEARLWAYIDGLSEERPAIEKLLAENRIWKEKYAELLHLHGMLAATELEQPSLRFTKNVMEEIARTQIAPAAKTYINKKIIWGIAAFFFTAIVGFLAYGLSQLNLQPSSAKDAVGRVKLPDVDYSVLFNNTLVNGFVMLNVLLGLFLLDRFLAEKRKKFLQPK